MKVKGKGKLIANMKTIARKRATKGRRNMQLACLYLKGKSQKQCPVVTGNLKGSAFTRVMGQQVVKGIVGYGATYAARVHENPNAGKSGRNKASKVGKWKFLEDPLKDNEKKLKKIMAGRF